MEKDSYRALVASEDSDNNFTQKIESRCVSDLPPGDVLIRVRYSSLNYKDALSAAGNRGVTKKYPHVPGIDAAGIVEHSETDKFDKGDQVIVTSFDLGMNTPGGYGQFIRVPSDWVLPLPANLTLRESMAYGTAGLTAALSVLKLVEFPVSPDQGKILVSGATGGVGSIAISILAKLGYHVTAVSGKSEAHEYLTELGAEEIISRQEASDSSGKLLLREKWAGVVDTVGGEILAAAIKSTAYNGAVTCCGNAASHELPISVYPFILRGVSLMGIDSAQCPMETRLKAWQKLADEWKIDILGSLVSECTLTELPDYIKRILQGGLTGRVLVNLL
jgi:putative YhdH/YhfP family quinone oxidoreductase